MGTYTGNSNVFHNGISIIERYDLVLGGSETAPSNIPIGQLGDNSSHLKKFKGTVFTGNGTPSDAIFPVNFVIDVDTNDNVRYLDELTGSFWRRTGTNTWTNIGKGAILNVKGLRLNDNGNDLDSVYLKYNATNGWVELRNHADNEYADLRVGTLRYDSADGSSETISNFVDTEILILSGITTSSQNADGFYSVKHLIDQSGAILTVQVFEIHGYDRFILNTSPTVVSGDLIQVRNITQAPGDRINKFYKVSSVGSLGGGQYYIEINRSFAPIEATTDKTAQIGYYAKDNSAQLRWDNFNNRFELRTRSGQLLPIDVSGLFVNSIPLRFMASRIISSTLEFNRLFNHITNPLTNECHLRTPESNYLTSVEDQYIYVWKSELPDNSYTLSSMVVIEKSNVKLEFAPGVTIKFNDVAGLGQNIGFRFKDETDLISTIDITGTNRGDHYFQVKSYDYYFKEGLHALSTTILPQIDMGSKVMVFSGNSTPMARKHTVANHKKEIFQQRVISAITGTPFDQVASIGGSWAFDIQMMNIGAYSYIFIAKYDPASDAVILYRVAYDVETHTLGSFTFNLSFMAGFGSPLSSIRIVHNDSRMVVIATRDDYHIGNPDLYYREVNPNDVTDNYSPQRNSDGVAEFPYDSLRTIKGVITNDNKLYIAGAGSIAGDAYATEMRLFYVQLNTNPQLNSTIQLSTRNSMNVDSFGQSWISFQSCLVGIDTDGTNVYCSWFDWNNTNNGPITGNAMKLTSGTHGNWVTNTVSTPSVGGVTDPYHGLCGLCNDVVVLPNPNSTGNYLVHVVFSGYAVWHLGGLYPLNCSISIVDPNNSFSYTETPVVSAFTNIVDWSFVDLYCYKNKANTYKAEPLVTISLGYWYANVLRTSSYLNDFGPSNVPDLTMPLHGVERGKITGISDPLGASGFSQYLHPIGATNNYIIYIGSRYGSTGAYLDRFEYVQNIQAAGANPWYQQDIPSSIILSNDFSENVEISGLTVQQLGSTTGPNLPNGGLGSYVETRNTIGARINNLTVVDGKYKNAITGATFSPVLSSPTPYKVIKTFNTTVDNTTVDNSNALTVSAFDYIGYGNLLNFYVETGAAPKTFNNVSSSNVQGIIQSDSSMIQGNGDFDGF